MKIRDRIVELRRVRARDLVPHPKNWRSHPPGQQAALRGILAEVGYADALLARETEAGLQLIDGHLRAETTPDHEVPVLVLDVTEDEAEKLLATIDPLAALAGRDDEALAALLATIKTDSEGLAALFAGLAPVAPKGGLTDPDAVPETPDEPEATRDDVWRLGPHRVMCGDSTDAADVERLMDGACADLVFTDPPYGMSYGGGRAAGSTPRGARVKAHGEIVGDDLRDEDLVGLVREALLRATDAKKPGAPMYVCLTWRTYPQFEAALKEAGIEPAACIVWDKGSIGLGYAHYRPQHEFILYAKGEGASWYGGQAQGDLWTLGRGCTEDYRHPTQKPVALVERALHNSSKQGDVVYDCFGGSGSTLVACERLGRKARLMEIDPKYVDVIVRRWEEYTGKKGRRGPCRETG